MVRGARLARIYQQPRDGIDGYINHAADGSHGQSLNQHGEDLHALGEGQLVHAPVVDQLRHDNKHYVHFKNATNLSRTLGQSGRATMEA